MRLTLADLNELCNTHAEEDLRLEFKACSELREGANRREGSLTKDKIAAELSKDVSSFLNADGGTIVYGINERKDRKTSRAESLDVANAFKPTEKLGPEWLTQMIRSHISPPPSNLQVYRIFLDGNQDSSWFLVVELPPGQIAYQANNKVFYKRVGATSCPMEQYEVADVMRREQGPSIAIRVTPGPLSPFSIKAPDVYGAGFRLTIEVTSTNYIAAEYGALKLTVKPPLFISTVPSHHSQHDLRLETLTDGEVKMRWGVIQGQVALPGDWLTVYSPQLQVRPFNESAEESYSIEIEAFAVRSFPRKFYFLLRQSWHSIAIEEVKWEEP
jgi:hypothetical protein